MEVSETTWEDPLMLSLGSKRGVHFCVGANVIFFVNFLCHFESTIDCIRSLDEYCSTVNLPLKKHVKIILKKKGRGEHEILHS